jgi:hypothetical protein
LKVIKQWEDWSIYPEPLLHQLLSVFGQSAVPNSTTQKSTTDVMGLDIDGVPIDDIDGVPISDIDGDPIDGQPFDDIDGVPIDTELPSSTSAPPAKKSKWDDECEPSGSELAGSSHLGVFMTQSTKRYSETAKPRLPEQPSNTTGADSRRSQLRHIEVPALHALFSLSASNLCNLGPRRRVHRRART